MAPESDDNNAPESDQPENILKPNQMPASREAAPNHISRFMKSPPISRAPPPSGTLPGNEVNDDYFGTLRRIRAELENLRTSLELIRNAHTSDKTDNCEKKFKSVWYENRDIINLNIQPVTNGLTRINTVIYNAGPEGCHLYDISSDEVTRIENQWQRFVDLWERLGESKKYDGTTEILGRIDELEKLLCSMIFRINILTMPDRINDHLESLMPGQELKFLKNVGDELCKEGDASPILIYIKNHPWCINGVVDEEKGIIYKVDPSFWRKAGSFLGIAFIWGLSFLFVLSLPQMLSATRYPFSIAVPGMTISNVSVTSIDFASSVPVDTTMIGFFLCACYALVIIGGLSHVLIGGLKQAKSAPAGSRLAVEGWIRWFHINEQQNWATAVSLFVGFVFMIVILKTADYATAFFIGYSIDSVLDLFITRVNIAATVKINEIKKTVSPSNAEAAT